MLIVEVNHGELQSICACYQNNLPDIEVLRNILNLEILSESPQRKLSRQMAFCKKKKKRDQEAMWLSGAGNLHILGSW